MTVEEYLNGSDADYIKLGAKGGQSFIFCGRLEDAKKFLETYDKPCVEKLHANLLRVIHEHALLLNGGFNKTAERLIEQYKRYRQERKNGGAKNKKLEPFKTLTAYKRHLKKMDQEEIKRLERRIERCNKRLQNYTPILSREIVEIYQAILYNEDGATPTIIIFQGDEAGNSWDLTEFRNGGYEYETGEE